MLIASPLDSVPTESTDRVRGPVLTPGQLGYTEELAGFNLLLEQRPAVVVGATGPADVRAAVRFAARHGLPVAVQATGHGQVRSAEGAVLITTHRMDGVRIDPVRRTARVGAGTRWEQVIHEAAGFGLAPLNGSSPLVGAVGYTLGGGLGVLGRTFGYAADHVVGLDLVTADGTLREVTAQSEPDLFWALRGGKGNFGVVTSMEIALLEVERLYGGTLIFDGSLAPAVLHAWREWTATAPEELTSSVALIRYPDAPGLPVELRGRFRVAVRIAYVGPVAAGERLVAPLRALGPRVVDSLRDLPYSEVASIYADPTEPYAFHERTMMLGALDAEAVDALLGLAGPGTGCPVGLVELRHLGGALARPPRVPSAVSNRDAAYLLFLCPAGGPGAAGVAYAERLLDRLEPFGTGGRYLNFLDSSADEAQIRSAYSEAAYRRLAAVKAVHDPANLFRLTHTVPPLPAESR
ncbi:FAD-binding oxidoreductase [Streptomyces sp. NPDC092296]|uniref:FAD-binding oxidoreductase n=1 Tax=Streptomyces sp. NPDC092296 TaxID=3366012 RepID=UPI00382AD719